MDTLRPGKKVDETIGYTAQICINKSGVQVYQECQALACKPVAEGSVSTAMLLRGSGETAQAAWLLGLRRTPV